MREFDLNTVHTFFRHEVYDIAIFRLTNLSDVQEYIHVFASLKSRTELVHFVRRDHNQIISLISWKKKSKTENQFRLLILFDINILILLYINAIVYISLIIIYKH